MQCNAMQCNEMGVSLIHSSIGRHRTGSGVQFHAKRDHTSRGEMLPRLVCPERGRQVGNNETDSASPNIWFHSFVLHWFFCQSVQSINTPRHAYMPASAVEAVLSLHCHCHSFVEGGMVRNSNSNPKKSVPVSTKGNLLTISGSAHHTQPRINLAPSARSRFLWIVCLFALPLSFLLWNRWKEGTPALFNLGCPRRRTTSSSSGRLERGKGFDSC